MASTWRARCASRLSVELIWARAGMASAVSGCAWTAVIARAAVAAARRRSGLILGLLPFWTPVGYRRNVQNVWRSGEEAGRLGVEGDERLPGAFGHEGLEVLREGRGVRALGDRVPGAIEARGALAHDA